MPRPALLFVGVVSLVRLVVASRFPLTGDEAYYWSWSRHLAFGYVDHPPMVAWLIALGSAFGQGPGFVRFPFVACEAAAALLIGGAATRLARDPRAGGIAAVAFTLLPQTKLALGEALPDGPYVACWALAVFLLARVGRGEPSWRLLGALGCALGGALLSRAFGWALVFGVFAYALGLERRALRARLWFAFAIAALAYAPFVLWNATHGWETLAFTLHDRQPFEAFGLERMTVLSSLRLVVVALCIWCVAVFVALRPRRALVAWTALPLPTLLVAVACFYKVESYWILGPLASLCVGFGAQYPAWSRAVRGVLAGAGAAGFAYVTLAALFVAAPERTQARLLDASSGRLRGPFYSGAFAYAPLSANIRALAPASSTVVLTDSYEIASELAYAGLTPRIIGVSPEFRQWHEWMQPAPPLAARALFVSYAPLRYGSVDRQIVAGAYSILVPGPTLQPRFAGLVADTFYTTWCSRPERDAVATLFGRRP